MSHRPRRLRIPVIAVLAASALVVAACGDDEVSPQEVEELYEEDLQIDGLPETQAGAQLAWILQSLHPDGDLPTPGQIADRMAPPLDGMIPPGNLLSAFQDLREQGPWTVVDAMDGEAQASATLIDAADDEEVVIHVTVDSNGAMIGLFFAGEEEVDPDVAEELDDLSDQNTAETDATDAEDSGAVDSDEPVPDEADGPAEDPDSSVSSDD